MTSRRGGVARAGGKVGVLSVSPARDDHAALGLILKSTKWKMVESSDIEESRQHLLEDKMAVVICGGNLAPGDYELLLAANYRAARPAKVIVVLGSLSGTFWEEALGMGCYDVLAKPLMAGEVLQVIDRAWKQWQREYGERTASGKAPRLASRPDDALRRMGGAGDS